ncbi:MAG: DUF4011 domain-containing protein [Candidatus Omnitrophota bacterium]|jgi:hypothetical protein|nr:MAG: DUF4011 domain-containing protein [Candidatus Omnitrophota bacterium]
MRHQFNPQTGIDVELEYDTRINFALQQNDVPMIKALRIHNRGDAMVEDVKVKIWGEPGLASTWERQLSQIAPESTYNIDAVDLIFSPDYLIQQSERQSGLLWIQISWGENVLCKQSYPYELLAYNEWSGIQSLPEILAAFVMPNHPIIEKMLIQVRERLNVLTGESALSAYQSNDARRARQMAQAVYQTMQDWELTYIAPPASFEQLGQKIRTPDQIFDTRMGTCLDLAVLAAACLEQMGLHPLIALIRGHAFAGVWLNNATFPDSCIDELVRIRKRADLDEILVFETTDVTHRPPVDFDQAVNHAKRYLYDDENFIYAIDIRAARIRRIRPISARLSQNQYVLAENQIQQEHAEPPKTSLQASITMDEISTPSVGTMIDESSVETFEMMDEHPAGKKIPDRIERWKKKLLDLSLRNRLINFRETKKSFPIVCSNLSALEDALSNGKAFQILALPDAMRMDDPRDAALYHRRTGDDATETFLQDQLKSGYVYTPLTNEELERRLIQIYREARIILEEGGTNTLYLALGFLRWFESPSSDLPRSAPLILLPLELVRNSVREGFRMRLADDEARINVTLLQKLETEFGLAIPRLDPLPSDDSGIDIPKIVRIFREKVVDIHRWEVLEIAFVGHFSFNKYLMWVDLEEHLDDLMENPVVRHMATNPEQSYNDGIPFPDADRLDELRTPSQTYCPVDADSSQLSAVFAANDGKSFILEGPPGTGKSQTITNLIAHCLAEGKRVLFVSEKMAALDVVYHRLCEVGLGPFCLELHSNKIQKRRVLAQLEEALTVTPTVCPKEWSRETNRLNTLRNDLNEFIKTIGAPREFGQSVFHGLSKLIKYRDTAFVSLNFDENTQFSEEQFLDLNETFRQWLTAARSVGIVAEHPWRAANLDAWRPSLELEISSLADAMMKQIEVFEKTMQPCADELRYPELQWSQNDVDTIVTLAQLLLQPIIPQKFLLETSQWDVIQSQINAWIEIGIHRDSLRAKFFTQFREEVLKQDLDILRDLLQQSLVSYPPFSWFRAWKAARALKPFAKQQKLPAKHELLDFVELAQMVNAEQKKLDQAESDAQRYFGQVWKQGEADWTQIKNITDWTNSFRALYSRIPADDVEQIKQIKQRWIALAIDVRETTSKDSRRGKAFQRLCEINAQWKELQRQLEEKLQLDPVKAWGEKDAHAYFPAITNTLNGWICHPQLLIDWCNYIRGRKSANELLLTTLFVNYESGSIAPEQLPAVFEHSFYRWWIHRLFEKEELLRDFFSAAHNQKINTFQKLDRRVIEMTQAVLWSTLSDKIPHPDAEVSANSEVGILRREIKKKNRHMSIRRLCRQLKNLLPVIKPCFLMSPLSAAQFLGGDTIKFDVVVFDEASQIPVWDAIGAIARGKQVIVVGDSKQLPPTNFFQKVEEEEFFDEEEIIDLESNRSASGSEKKERK